MAYDVVLFDLDHTLLDTERSFEISFNATMRSLGIASPSTVRDVFDDINNGLWLRVERGELNPDELHVSRFRLFFDEAGVDGDPLRAAARFANEQVESAILYDGARDLIEQTTARCRTAIITNGIGAIQRGVLRTLGLDNAFHAVVISSELGINKPSAAFFDSALGELDVTDRSTVVIVGDSLTSDIQGGINAGIDTVWFDRHNTGHGSIQPTHVATSLEEIKELLNRGRWRG